MTQNRIILLIFVSSFAFGQFQFNGYINPEAKIRNNSGEVLDLPYRISQFNFSYTFAMIDIISKGGVEFRNETMESLFSLREFYIGFYPSFGEIRLGKQINSWGLADGNNPTDNLNPYDLNYMFLTGTDRKVGSLSLTFDTYINDHKIGVILIPYHEPNRFPIEDTDFKMDDNEIPPSNNEDEFQWGLSLQSMLGESDIMLTYFNGYDFAPSYSGKNLSMELPLKWQFEYRKTQVFGVSIVSFWNDLTFRTEFAYFDTKTALDLDKSAKYKAEYLQYVFQLEYPVPSDMTLTAQLIGNNLLSIEGTIVNDDYIIDDADFENFNMGLGTPFAAFSKLAIIGNTAFSLFDELLSIELNGMIDLEDQGYMLGGNLTYTVNDNLDLDAGIVQFIGNDSDDYLFTKLEDFSHMTFQLKYSF